MEPSKTLSTGPLSGTKKSKNRVTILLTFNATGSMKLPALFIHKYKTPRDLTGIDKSKLPVDYFWNKSAWMQKSIWNKYLELLNKKMKRLDKKILLLVDNATVHAVDNPELLTNITIHSILRRICSLLMLALLIHLKYVYYLLINYKIDYMYILIK